MHDSIDRGSDLYTSQLSLPVWLGRKDIWFGMNMNMSQFYFLSILEVVQSSLYNLLSLYEIRELILFHFHLSKESI